MGEEKPKTAWWKTGVLAALLGAMIPVATFVQGCLQKERELTIQELQQVQELRMAYMNVMVEGGVDSVEMIADFIADTERDPGIRAWAEQQRKKALATAGTLEAKAAKQQAEAAAAAEAQRVAEERAAKAEAEARRLADQAGADREARMRAEKAAEEAKAAAAKAGSNARAKEDAVTRTRETLQGRANMRVDLPIQQIRMTARTAQR